MFEESQFTSLCVPKYKEFSVAKIWRSIKEFEEYKVYFPDYIDTEKPERDFLIEIVSIINPGTLRSLINSSREALSITSNPDRDNLVVLTNDLKTRSFILIPRT